MKTTIASIALFAIFLTTAGCHSTKPVTQPGGATPGLTVMPAPTVLNGTWELQYISGPKIAFNGLYPEKKPRISFDVEGNKFSGNAGCNSMNGKLIINGAEISFPEPYAMTRMLCPGQGEQVFLQTLKKVDSYNIYEGNVLGLIAGHTVVMRFVKK
jgi:heat shock protein HslJ